MQSYIAINNDPTTIPSRDKIADNDYCSKPYTGQSIYQIARQNERNQLGVACKAYSDTNALGLDTSFTCFIPNGKLVWANRVIKDAINNPNKWINPCDKQLLNAMWMNQRAKSSLSTFLDTLTTSTNVEPHLNYPTKSSILPTCSNGEIKYNIKNPGVFNMASNEWEQYPSESALYDEVRQYNYMTEAQRQQAQAHQPNIQMRPNFSANYRPDGSQFYPVRDSLSCANDGGCACPASDIAAKTGNILQVITELQNRLVAAVDIQDSTSILDELDIDPKLKKLLDYVRENLYDKHINWAKLKEIAKAFSSIAEIQTGRYLLAIMQPFLHRFTKVPTELPMPSSSFSVRANVDLNTNALGRVAFSWNPFFLNATGESTFGINNDATLNGLASNNNFIAQNISQNMPVLFYNRYRIVSAALKITFTTSQLSSTGFGTLAVDFSDNASVAAIGAVLPSAAPFGIFARTENGYFKETKSTRDNESIQVNYLPLDSSFTDYFPVGTTKLGFNIIGYVTGAPVSSTIARIDLVTNYEALVANEYTDFLPCQVYTGGLDDLKTINKIAIQIQSDGGTLSPENIQKVASQFKVDIDDQLKFKLPPLKQTVRAAKSNYQDLDELKKIVVEEMTQKLPPEKKQSVLSKIMGFISPIFGGAIETFANRMPQMFGAQFVK